MPFYTYFEDIFMFLYQFDNLVAIAAVFILLHVFVILMRVIVFLGYRAHNIMISMDLAPAKSLKTKGDAMAVRSSLLRRISADYLACAEKNAPRVPLEALVNKHVHTLSFIGWPYQGIIRCIEKLDNSLILLGIALAFIFDDYLIVFGLISILGFVIMKLASAFFDFRTAKETLIYDIHFYIEREVGQFYAGHTASAITKFKEEMTEAVDRQSVLLRGAIEKLNTDLIPILSGLKCLEDLPKSLVAISESNDKYAVYHEAFLTQANIIKSTQAALETSINSYETTLQNLVQTMGSGIGAFIKLHGQESAQGLTTVMQEHINLISENNRQANSATTELLSQLAGYLRVLNERISDL